MSFFSLSSTAEHSSVVSGSGSVQTWSGRSCSVSSGPGSAERMHSPPDSLQRSLLLQHIPGSFPVQTSPQTPPNTTPHSGQSSPPKKCPENGLKLLQTAREPTPEVTLTLLGCSSCLFGVFRQGSACGRCSRETVKKRSDEPLEMRSGTAGK